MNNTQKDLQQQIHPKIRPKGHSPTKTRGIPFQIYENPDLISQNWPHRDLKRTSIYKTQKIQAQKQPHTPPRAAPDSRRPTA